MPARIHLTVATVTEREGRILMVREWDNGRLLYNQPAGHVEPGETIQQAAIRETLEETRWRVALTALLGIYTRTDPNTGITYYRLCFTAAALYHDPDASLDPDIEEVVWLDSRRSHLRLFRGSLKLSGITVPVFAIRLV